MPALYVVATPIGNLEDISMRALRTLREVMLIAAEDTRKTKRLLNYYDIKTPLTSYHEHNKMAKLDYLLSLLDQGDVALVSDAGTPGLSDPGYELIVATHQRGIPVVPVPGPSAIITALAISGLATDRFTFLGFMPHKTGARKRALESVADVSTTLVILEAPHRIPETLHDIMQILGDRKLAVCRELTKLHEEIFRGTVSQAMEHFTQPKGEFTIVIEGKPEPDKPEMTEDIKQQLYELYLSGAKAKQAVTTLAAETGLSRKELYQTWLRLDKTWDRANNPCRNTGRS